MTIVIRAHLYAEFKMIKLLEEFLPKPRAIKIEKLSFATMLELVSALDLIREEVKRALTLLNKLGNRFAHELSAEIGESDVRGLVECFPETKETIGRNLDEAIDHFKAADDKAILNVKLRMCLMAIDAQLTATLDVRRRARTRARALPS